GNQWTVGCAIFGLARGGKKGCALSKFRTRSEALLDERIKGCVRWNQLEWGQIGLLRDKFHGRVEMQHLREASRGDALGFDGLPEGGLTSFFLDSDTKQVTFEGDTGIERVPKL